MELHANAALSLKKRRLLAGRVVEEGWTLTQAAEAAEVSVRTAGKWTRRYRASGELGLLDRSSAPRRVHGRSDERRIEAVAALRRLRMTGAEIAELLSMPLSTVSGILTRIGLGKLSRLEPPEPANRYERARPGELLHIDVKKLGRIADGPGHRAHGDRSRQRRVVRAGKRTTGWEFVHVCVDDATRLAYAEVLGDEKAPTAIGTSPQTGQPRTHAAELVDSARSSRLETDCPAPAGVSHRRTLRPRASARRGLHRRAGAYHIG